MHLLKACSCLFGVPFGAILLLFGVCLCCVVGVAALGLFAGEAVTTLGPCMVSNDGLKQRKTRTPNTSP